MANLATAVARDVGLLALFPSSNTPVVTPLSYPSPSVQALIITCLKLVVSTTAMVTTDLMVLGAHLCPALNIQLQPVSKGSVSGLPLRYGPSNQR